MISLGTRSLLLVQTCSVLVGDSYINVSSLQQSVVYFISVTVRGTSIPPLLT